MSDKLKELILYIAQEMDAHNHAGRGRIKLAKLVWRSDFAAYWALGHSITGARYIADTHGPKFENEREVIQEMRMAGEFDWAAGFDVQKIPTALRDPDMSVFSDEERAIIDNEIQTNRSRGGAAMRHRSHDFPGYKHAWSEGPGTEIPYESVFWEAREKAHDWEEDVAVALRS